MKILHVNLNYNQSLLYKELTEHLTSNGCNNVIYYPSIHSGDKKVKEDFLINPKILKQSDRFFFKRRNKKLLKNIQTSVELKKYDILHAHSLFSNGMLAYSLNKKYGTKYIVAVRDTDVNLFFKRMLHLRKIGIEILVNASKVIFLSEGYRDYVLSHYIPDKLKSEIMTKTEVIPNGINSFWLENKNTGVKSTFNKEKIKVLSVGVINKRKNGLITAEVCKLIEKELGLNIELKIVGKIADRGYYNSIKNVYDFIHVKRLEKEQLLKAYRESDVFILPSITETFGLVYAEAMSQGLPVIYTRNQGFDKHFEEGLIGYAVEADNVLDIVEKIKLILENNQIRKNCIQNVNKFDWNLISKKYIEIYEGLVSEDKND